MRPRLYTPGQRAATKVAYAIPRSRRLLSPPPSSYGIGAGGQNKLAHRCLLRSQRHRLESVQLGSSSPGGAQAADLHRQEEPWSSSSRSLSLRRRRGSLATAAPLTLPLPRRSVGSSRVTPRPLMETDGNIKPSFRPGRPPRTAWHAEEDDADDFLLENHILDFLLQARYCLTKKWLPTTSDLLHFYIVVWGSGHDGLPNNEETVLRRSQ